MLAAPDFPVALVVAAVPVLVPLNEGQLSYTLKHWQSKATNLPDPLPEPVVVAAVAVGVEDPV
jgi:hypothetical protein